MNTTNAKIHGSMGEMEYRKVPGHRSSVLAMGLLSMASLKAAMDAQAANIETQEDMNDSKMADKLFGLFFHDMLLQAPDVINREYHFPAEDKLNWTTVAGKAQKERVLAEANGRGIIWPTVYAKAERMRDMVVASPGWKTVETMKWTSELVITATVNGVPVKCRLDAYCPESNTVMNLKTTRNGAPYAFQRDISKMYWFQASLESLIVRQLTGFEPTYWWGAAEKVGAHNFQGYQFDLASQTRGIEKVERLLERTATALRTNQWPGYSESGGFLVYNFPAYLMDDTGGVVVGDDDDREEG